MKTRGNLVLKKAETIHQNSQGKGKPKNPYSGTTKKQKILYQLKHQAITLKYSSM